MSRDYRLRVSSPYFLYLYVQKYKSVASVDPPVAVGPCALHTLYTLLLRHRPSLRHLSASKRLSHLHWLLVHYRIQFKIATRTYKTVATCQPSYLCDLLQVHQPSRALRSSTQQLLLEHITLTP